MSAASTVLTEKDQTERDALLGRLYTSPIGALELFHVFLGERLGLYQALASKGALNAAELAATAGIDERYAREWLEQELWPASCWSSLEMVAEVNVATASPVAMQRC